MFGSSLQRLWTAMHNSRSCKLSGSVPCPCRYMWDLTRADASGQTPLHLAARLGDEGYMAGLILRHPSCSAAGALWSTLKDASGQTPADAATRC